MCRRANTTHVCTYYVGRFAACKQALIVDTNTTRKPQGHKKQWEKHTYINIIHACNKEHMCNIYSHTCTPANTHIYPNEHTQHHTPTHTPSTQASTSVRHLLLPCHWSQRNTLLADLLRSYGCSGRTIVFTETKNDANELATSLATVAEARPLHGDIPQSQREVCVGGGGVYRLCLCREWVGV